MHMKTCTVPLNEVSETVDQPAGRPVGKHCQIGRRSDASSTAVSTLDPPGLLRLANPELGDQKRLILHQTIGPEGHNVIAYMSRVHKCTCLGPISGTNCARAGQIL